MSFDNVEVKVTVKVNGERVGRRKVTRTSVSSVQDGRSLLNDTHRAVDALAGELRARVGV